MKKIVKKMSLLLLAALAAAPAFAQPWEEVLGPPNTREQGEKRVAQVRFCSNDGYIAVGTQDVGGLSQAYVVRTRANGATLFEIAYDIGDDGLRDEGNAVVELNDGTGFVVLGSALVATTTTLQNWNLFLLKIDCNGLPQWTNRYAPPITVNWNLFGRDLVQATSGNGAVGTAAGDLLVAGYVDLSTSSSNAFLMRTTVAGAPIWNRRYSFGAAIQRFFGLTEASPAVAPTGDVVGVGVWTPTGATSQALALRASGDTGLLGGAFACAFTYGGQRDESFAAVTELRTAPQTGNLAMAGRSTTPGAGEDIYLVKTQRNPCNVLNQSTIGNSAVAALGEVANDLKEVLVAVDPAIGVPVGALALTGYRGTTLGTNRDAYLLFASSVNLLPLSGSLFGDHAARSDAGSSLAQNAPGGLNPPGFILAGMSESDFAAVGDGRDLYQIQANNSGRTNCSIHWLPPATPQTWTSTSPATVTGTVVTPLAIPTDFISLATNFLNCP